MPFPPPASSVNAQAATPTDPAADDGRYLAVLARDARFDGHFFTGVTSTGIYCRPVCAGRAPRRENCRFFALAAQAESAGFRPCLRCRPEVAPQAQTWSVQDASGILVQQAVRLLDAPELWPVATSPGPGAATVARLAERLGVSDRHLRRIFETALGVSPLQYLQTRRLLTAKQLLTDTRMPVTQVALASGFASVRRFNAAFSAAYGKPPREIRRGRASAAPPADELVLRLPYRAPYDFAHLLAFLARRAIPGVEAVDAHAYRRSIVVDDVPGWFAVAQMPGDRALALRVHHPNSSALGVIAARVKRMFDVDADPRAIALAFRRSELMKPLIRRWPGQRLPGAWDGFELAVRAVLGQQVSVAAARTLAGRIVAAYGTPFADDGAAGLGALFPTPATLVDAPLETHGITRARAATIRGLAAATLDGRIAFRAEQPLAAFENELVALPGIGAWTAHYIAMRALAQPDAFPAADLILRRAAGQGRTLATRELETLGEQWRPWRAYAVMLLWRNS